MNVKQIIKFFRSKGTTQKSMNWLNKKLFDTYADIITPITDDNNLFTKQTKVYVHQFISEPDILLLTNDILREVITEMMRKKK